MLQNYPRDWTITVGGLGTYSTADGLRVRFSIKQATVHSPNIATIRLTNINRSNAEQFCKSQGSEGKPVTISAGYAGNSGILFKGYVVRPIYGRENPTDTLCQVLCTDGHHATQYGRVNKSFGPGSTPQNHFDAVMDVVGQYGVSKGYIGPNVDLSQPQYPRGVMLNGMAHKILEDIARSKGATWGVQNGLVNMLRPDDQGQGGAFVLNSSTGLIGMPTLTIDGVYCRTLINPQMQIDGRVQIDQSLIQGYLPGLGPQGQIAPDYSNDAAQAGKIASIAADGIYRIIKIDTEADTRGQPWYMDMMVLNPGASTAVSHEFGFS